MPKISLYIFLISLLFSCSQENLPINEITTDSSAWLVDTNEMTGTDTTRFFPLITKPNYETTQESTNLFTKERVIVFKIDETVFIYPTWLMGVEVINDEFNGVSFAVTYCPKTRTSYVINRVINNQLLTFKASGVLYNENLVFYDIETGSFWSQMLFKGIHGKFFNHSPDMINSFEISYGAARQHYPGAKILAGYANKTMQQTNNNYQNGDMVMGIMNHSFAKPASVTVFNLAQSTRGLVQEGNSLIIFDKEMQFINALQPKPGLTFAYTGNFPGLITDNEGNTWNAFGEAVSGPQKGEAMESQQAFLALWWAWQGTYDNFHFIIE